MSKKEINPEDRVQLMEYLIEIEKNEKSNFAKMIFQENIIQIEIITLIYFLDLLNFQALNYSLSGCKEIKRDKILNKKFLSDEIFPFGRQGFLEKNYTLGQLITFLEYAGIDNLNNDNIINDLKKFNNLRNKITHNIGLKYENKAQLEGESKEIVKIGSKIMAKLDILFKRVEEVHRKVTSQYFKLYPLGSRKKKNK